MARIEVKKVPKAKGDPRKLYAEVCWYYPQYKLHEVTRMPAKDVTLLLRNAYRKEAEQRWHLTQIAAGPHTKNMAGSRTLSSRYKQAMRE
jgi:hypothetical protein